MHGWAGGSNGSVHVAAELLWVSQPAENQPHAADIRLFMTMRAVAKESQIVKTLVHELLAVASSTIAGASYDYARVEFSDYQASTAKVDRSLRVALCKAERWETFNTPLVPEAFVFERFPTTAHDLSRIASTLIKYPHCSVRFQLMPTRFSSEEQERLGLVATTLGALDRGINDMSIGQLSFVTASRAAQAYEYYELNKHGPLFEFNIVIQGTPEGARVVASRLHGHLSDEENTSSLGTRLVVLPAVDSGPALLSDPWTTQHELRTASGSRSVSPSRDSSFSRFPFVITGQEALEFFRAPISHRTVGAGFRVNKSKRESRNYTAGVLGDSDIDVGSLETPDRNVPLGLALTDLTKHMLIVGTPGSGKTTFTLGLLEQAWRRHGIPFLVIEPAKSEYRSLLEAIPELQIFTPGKSTVSPYVVNPFLPPENVLLESYKSTLKTAFAAGVTMTSPLDRIFEDAVAETYSRHGWMNHFTSADGGSVFSIHEFLAVFQDTFENIGYTGDAQNIGRAGLVRLGGMTRLFDTYQSIPIGDILTRPTVIELAAIENADEKALIIALVLLSILSYANANYVGDGSLRQLLLLEEAHVLLDADERGAGVGEASPVAIAKKLFKRMLAEIRSTGIGMIVADQSPRAVGQDVVALTNVKVGFRLVEATDKEVFAESTNMTTAQTQRLATLRPGEALLFSDKLDAPEEIITPDVRKVLGLSVSLDDRELRKRNRYWDSHQSLLLPYPECAFLPEWNYEIQGVAKELAHRVMRDAVPAQSSNIDVAKEAYSAIPSIVQRELPSDMTMDSVLLGMVRLYFLRLVKFTTEIPISDGAIKSTLLNHAKQTTRTND